jgi:hypothetical protein
MKNGTDRGKIDFVLKGQEIYMKEHFCICKEKWTRLRDE